MMSAYCCSNCQKKLSACPELTGKQLKCPECGGVSLVSLLVAAPAVDKADVATMLPPAHPTNASRVGSLKTPDASRHATHSQGIYSETTQGYAAPCLAPSPNLTDFLATPQTDDELGRLGKYRILEVMGHGGMGVVYKGEDPVLKRSVAVKAMLPALAACASAGQRFLREAQAMAAVEHDHIVRIYQVEEASGIPFMAMEFLKGEPLDERLKREPRLPPAEVVRIGREIAEGLTAAHERGLIHRDIKPANVWLEAPRDRVKILDFGLARAAQQESGLTQQGAVLGTPEFMAPEQARGEAVDARSDLFSLGGVLYRMTTGQLPFRGKDTISTLMAVCSEQPTAPAQLDAGVPQELSDLVMKLLEKETSRRLVSAGEVAEALRELERKLTRQTGVHDDVQAVRPEPPDVRGRGARWIRRPLVIAVALISLLPVVWWLAGLVLRVETTDGTLVVEISDDETEARIKNGKLVLTGRDGKVRYMLSPADRDKKIEAGPYKVRVEGVDGLTLDTPDFNLKKGGKVVVRVTAAPRPVAKNSDPDRKAAEYVLSLGGSMLVRVGFKRHWVRAVSDLPISDLSIVHIDLSGTHADDAGMKQLARLKELELLDIRNSMVSDPGLEQLKTMPKLSSLKLDGPAITDAGMMHLRNLTNLSWLELQNTTISNDGLKSLEKLTNLRLLWLYGTKISDDGLKHLHTLTKLKSLRLDGTDVTDEGLNHLQKLTHLQELDVAGTKVTSKGVGDFLKSMGGCRVRFGRTR